MRPRVLVLTARRWYRHLSHTVVLDVEDAMAELAEVTLHDLPEDALSPRPLAGRGSVAVPPEGPYDLALLVAMSPSWLRALRAARGLRGAARRVAVYVFDAWPQHTRALVRWRRQLAAVDHLFVSFPEAVPVYAPRVPGAVHALPQATSPERFRPDRAERPIDLLSIGRRHEGAHRRLVELARADDLLYVFSDRASSRALDLEDSRYASSALSRAARCHVAWPVEATSPGRAGPISPVTARWFDAAACAAVALGRRPRAAEFAELFPYDGFVVEIDPAGDDLEQVVRHALHELDDGAERARLAEHVRTHHSWRRRCERMLEVALAE